MLIKTKDNKLNIIYKQNISINRVNSGGKQYEYKEINIPVELLNFWKSVLGGEITGIGYVVSGGNGSFITPFVGCVDEWGDYFSSGVGSCRVVPVKVRKRGTAGNPKYFIRVDSKQFKLLTNYVEFVVNPYMDDPYLKTKGLVSISNLVLL